ncbi:MAG TPA: TonB-dependent receptor [Myxococcaceae bacterium]|nr:TonB-dependent receptor [Myxococcaceae bacterium]
MGRGRTNGGRRNGWAAVLVIAALLPRGGRGQPAPPESTPAAPVIAPAGQTGQLTRPPAVDRFVEAEYPPAARAAGLEGRVLLEVDVSVHGDVTRAVVVGPAGNGFDEAALAAVRQFHFTPAEVDGKPTPVRINYAYDFVLAAPATEQAREGPVNFSGTVLERGTRRPLAGAEVALPDLKLVTTTDAQGAFRMRDVPAGTQRIVVDATGHDRFETTESFSAGKETRVRYFLLKRYFSPYETVVRAEREKKEVTELSLSLQEVQRIPGTYGDALKVVQNLPGVARAPFNGGLIAIRGTSPQDSGIFLDGERLPILYHFGGLTAVYNSELLQTVEYLPGNFPAYYGDIVGGVVDVRSRDPRTDGFHGVVEVNVLDADVVLEAPLGDQLSFAIAGRRSYLDVFLPLFLSSSSPSFTVAPAFDDAQLKLVWRPNPHHTLSLLALHSQDTLQLVTTSTPARDPTVGRNFSDSTGFNQLRLRYTYLDGPVRWDTIALFGETHVNLQIGITRGLDVTVNPSGFRSTLEYALSPAVTLAAGVDWLYQSGNLTAELPEPPREGEPRPGGPLNPILYQNEHAWQGDLGLWTEVRWRPVPSLLVIPALRIDQFQWNLQPVPLWTVDPRLAVRWTVAPPVTLKAGIGLYSEAPNIAAGETDAVFGNPALKAKQSLQTSVGVEWNITRSLLFTFETFYNRLSGVISSSTATVERDGVAVPQQLANTGQGRIWGFEVFLRQALTERIFGWLSYSFSKSQRLDAPGDQWRPFDFDQTHVLTAIVSYKLGAGWELGGRFRYATGNPRTPIVGAVKDDNTDSFVPIFGPVNSARLPNFVQLDVRVDKVWVFDTWSLDLYLDVQNVTDSREVEGVTYNFNYTQSVYFVGLPIVPVLGIKAVF